MKVNINSMANKNLIEFIGAAKLKSQKHFMTLKESKFTQFEILPIQENSTL